MFDDIKYLIKESNLPNSIKTALSVLVRAITWFAWIFVGVGILIKLDYFVYWMAFFMFFEGILLFTLIYVLILSIRHELKLQLNNKGEIQKKSNWVSEIIKEATKDALTKIFIVISLLILFIFVKYIGLSDKIIDFILNKL